MSPFLHRVQRALVLDPSLFEEVEHDHAATPQALGVVVAASVAGGLGNLEAALLRHEADASALSLVVTTAGFIVAWLTWSFVTLAVGTRLFGGVADMGEMQRALGFAAAPGLLMVVPALGLVLGLTWSLVAMVIAVRQALDFTTAKALGTVLVGAIVLAIVLAPVGCYLAARLG